VDLEVEGSGKDSDGQREVGNKLEFHWQALAKLKEKRINGGIKVYCAMCA
jgi:hypothetical protein